MLVVPPVKFPAAVGSEVDPHIGESAVNVGAFVPLKMGGVNVNVTFTPESDVPVTRKEPEPAWLGFISFEFPWIIVPYAKFVSVATVIAETTFVETETSELCANDIPASPITVAATISNFFIPTSCLFFCF